MLISKEGVKSIIDSLIDLNYQCYLLNDDDVDIRMLSKYMQKSSKYIQKKEYSIA